jgi:16S rRNA (uracil1498-N3)-methyltransferase
MRPLNFLLLDSSEVDAGGRAILQGRRAAHVSTVLRAEVGAVLRAGLVDGPLGSATVEAISEGRVVVSARWERDPEPVDDVLLLAVPRPKVLARIYAHAAALGFGRIVLFRSWRVEKSHLQSKALQPDVQREHLLAGLEQAGRTRLPRVSFFAAFKPFVEDQLAGLGLPPSRFCAHPPAPVATSDLAPLGGGFALAIGPEGGFLPYEVTRLGEHSFVPVSCGAHPLRTETAVAVLTGQLALLRARGRFAS